MTVLPDMISIGELAARSGVAPSALRFYEAEGLIEAERSTSGRRRYARSTLRRVAFIRAAQRVGLSLEEIRVALRTMPTNRTPTKADWARLSRRWRRRLDEEIEALVRLRDGLTECIGCGCLSLQKCRLYNMGDRAARKGPGSPYMQGDVDWAKDP